MKRSQLVQELLETVLTLHVAAPAILIGGLLVRGRASGLVDISMQRSRIGHQPFGFAHHVSVGRAIRRRTDPRLAVVACLTNGCAVVIRLNHGTPHCLRL